MDWENVANLGAAVAMLLGDGKRAFFENHDGLRLRVVEDFPGWPQPTLQGIAFDHGRPVLTWSGLAGASYLVQSSTNLTSWENVDSVFAHVSPMTWTNSAGFDNIHRFFRVLLAP